MNHLANIRGFFTLVHGMNCSSIMNVSVPMTVSVIDDIKTFMRQNRCATTITGAEFKNTFGNYHPCKVIRPNEKIVYKEGLVSGDEQFNQYIHHKGRGLSFTSISTISKYICTDDDKIAMLDLIDNETICIGDSDCETNSFIVKKILDVGDFVRMLQETNYDDFMELIRNRPRLLKHVHEQTEEICICAVSNDYDNSLNMRFFLGSDECFDDRAMNYVKTQTEEISKCAVKRDGMMLRFVQTQTEEICRLAIDQNPYAITYVKNKTEELCKYASDKQIHRV